MVMEAREETGVTGLTAGSFLMVSIQIHILRHHK